MCAMASQITGVSIVCSTVCSGADQRKYRSSPSLAFVRGIHRCPVNSPHKGPVTRKLFPFDDVIIDRLFNLPLFTGCNNSMSSMLGLEIIGISKRIPWNMLNISVSGNSIEWHNWNEIFFQIELLELNYQAKIEIVVLFSTIDMI